MSTNWTTSSVEIFYFRLNFLQQLPHFTNFTWKHTFYNFKASSCLRQETQIRATLPTDRRRKCKRLQGKGVNLVAMGALVMPPKRLHHPLGTRIPEILPTGPRRRSRRLQAKAGKPQAALLSLVARRQVRLGGREDRLIEFGIKSSCEIDTLE